MAQAAPPPPPLFTASNNLARPIDGLMPAEDHFLHYTSLEALYSILENKTLQLTSIRSMNDPSEYEYGLAVVRRALSSPPDAFSDQEKILLSKCIPALDRREFQAFAFCMCEADDDDLVHGELSQWRLYGANGRGVALRFNRHYPLGQVNSWMTDLIGIARKVLYGEEEGRKIIFSEIREFLDAAKKELGSSVTFDQFGFDELIVNTIFWLPSVIKHPAYRHERETRIVRGDIGAWVGNPVRFLNGAIRRPVIYLPAGVGHKVDHGGGRMVLHWYSPLCGVMIGPSADQLAVHDSVANFARAHDWGLELQRSLVPYRAL